MYPPPRTKELANTYIREAAIWEIAIPLVLNLRDLAGRLVVEDLDLAVDDLLLADHLDDVASLQIHADGVTAVGDFVTEALDLLEGGLESILRRGKH